MSLTPHDYDLDAASALALRHMIDVVRTGQFTLDDGSIQKLSPMETIRVCQILAAIQTKKPKVVSNPEDFILAATEDEDDT